MKIIHSVASLDPRQGGLARSVPQLSLALARRGLDVGLWSPKAVSILPDLPPDAGNIISIYSGDFAAVLEDFGMPELVHDHGIWRPCNRRVARVCRTRGIPRAVSPRGMLTPWALNHKRWRKRLAWWAYQKRDLQAAIALHAAAEPEAEQFRKLRLRPPILIAANGVERRISDRHRFDEAPVERPLRTALFLGRLHPIKGLPMLLEAWAALLPDRWQMRIVGPDEGHRDAIEGAVEAAGLSSVWSFEDSLEGEAKWQAITEADLFVLPSYSENFGIVVAEALVCATPVITTTGTPWHGLREEGCGYWVEPTAEALREALASACALTDKERIAMGERGKAWVEREFGWGKIAERVEAFYRKILV